MPRHTPMAVEVHVPSRAKEGAWERVDDLSLHVSVQDESVIVRRPEDPMRDYAVELRVLIRTLADAMADDPTLDKVWKLTEFLMGAVTTTSPPDWTAIELRARELAQLAAHVRPSSHA